MPSRPEPQPAVWPPRTIQVPQPVAEFLDVVRRCKHDAVSFDRLPIFTPEGAPYQATAADIGTFAERADREYKRLSPLVVAAFKAAGEPVLLADAAVKAVIDAWADTFLSALALADERAGKNPGLWLTTFPEAAGVRYKEVCQRNYNRFCRVSDDLHRCVVHVWSPPPDGMPTRPVPKNPANAPDLAKVQQFAKEKMKDGDGQKLLNHLCERGGVSPLVDVAVVLGWEASNGATTIPVWQYDGAYHSLQHRVSKQMKAARLGCHVSRFNNMAHISPGYRARPKK